MRAASPMEDSMTRLGMEDAFPFGKAKGKKIRDVEVSYLLWARDTKRKEMVEMFDDAVNKYLDEKRNANRKWKAQFTTPPPNASRATGAAAGLRDMVAAKAVAQEQQIVRAAVYDETWGAF